MHRDPIVEEVRRNREAIAREHGNDVDAIVAAFQREEAASGVKTVSFRPTRLRKPATRRKATKARRPKRGAAANEPGDEDWSSLESAKPRRSRLSASA